MTIHMTMLFPPMATNSMPLKRLIQAACAQGGMTGAGADVGPGEAAAEVGRAGSVGHRAAALEGTEPPTTNTLRLKSSSHDDINCKK